MLRPWAKWGALRAFGNRDNRNGDVYCFIDTLYFSVMKPILIVYSLCRSINFYTFRIRFITSRKKSVLLCALIAVKQVTVRVITCLETVASIGAANYRKGLELNHALNRRFRLLIIIFVTIVIPNISLLFSLWWWWKKKKKNIAFTRLASSPRYILSLLIPFSSLEWDINFSRMRNEILIVFYESVTLSRVKRDRQDK